MPETRLPFGIPESELHFSFARSSGPGGQNVNKTATKATLRWDVLHSPALSEDVRQRFLRAYASRVTREGELVIQAQRQRDQARNAAECVQRLAEMLRAVARPRRARKPTRPGRGAVERRLSEKRHRSQAKRERRGRDAD
ncbi:MAG TPA: alternative ribosome rescue aminoacyl-tRNA hydrolase ArfB [Myxococcota bacterium]|nr:alternative ribosome rescue aminoacyl-tRNA hydrolase ArfB [Myxococcota bacterium]